jgi:hypothetical protein
MILRNPGTPYLFNFCGIKKGAGYSSKPILDEIDCVLARHYGFTEVEMDFIINYDIKYRMGHDALEEDND